MIKDVLVFGDSFMYGQETNYTKFVNNKDFHTQFKQATGADFVFVTEAKDSGRVRMKYNHDWYKFLETLDPDVKENCNSNSIGNVLADKLNVSCTNLAMCGSSNNFILYKVIDNLSKINKDSLVICGLTSLTRKSLYQNKFDTNSAFITNLNPHIQQHKDLEKYQLLDLEIGNDYTALILETFAYMKAIVQMVEQQQAKVVFIDTFNVFDNIKDQVDVEYKHNHILDKINKYTEPTMAPSISNTFESIDDRKLYRYCPGGHYSSEVYQEYVNSQLIPYLENTNV